MKSPGKRIELKQKSGPGLNSWDPFSKGPIEEEKTQKRDWKVSASEIEGKTEVCDVIGADRRKYFNKQGVVNCVKCC